MESYPGVDETFYIHKLDNGLTLLGQRLEQFTSSAFTLLLPAGAALDPAQAAGASAVACDWLLRGAGQRTMRQLHDILDSLGCQHHEDSDSAHLSLSSAQLGLNLMQVLEVYADIVMRPHLGEDSFPACRDLVQQALEGLEDEPMRKCSLMVREQFYPWPLGRNPLGDRQSLEGMNAPDLRRHVQRCMTPRQSLLAVAGNFDWAELVDTVGRLFSGWNGQEPPPVHLRPSEGGAKQVSKQTAQAQIALAYPSVTLRHEQYYAARVAEMVLSGGMSARLFTEVREKRGLVYSVGARYHALKDYAGMFVYAGTGPERAQETLNVTVHELRRLGEGIEPGELARAKTQLKAALVMQGESTSARADALAGDHYHLGRLRSLAEISAAVDGVTVEQVLEHLRSCPPRPLTVLTISPKPLDLSVCD